MLLIDAVYLVEEIVSQCLQEVKGINLDIHKDIQQFYIASPINRN